MKPGRAKAETMTGRARARGKERSAMKPGMLAKVARLAIVLAVLVLATAAMAAQIAPVTQIVIPLATEAGRDRARFVRFYPMEGLPPDSLVRNLFMEGFDEGLATAKIETERQDAMGKWHAADSLGSRFGPSTDSTSLARSTPKAPWTMQVVVGAPPPYVGVQREQRTGESERHVDPNMRASRGMTVALLTLSPNDLMAGVRAAPEHFAFAFPAEAAPPGVLGDVPAGFAFPWRESGRITALLVLEQLHHRSGELPKAKRFRLPTVVRVESVR